MNRGIRWFTPVLIVLAAICVSWWSARTASVVEQYVRDKVIDLIPMVLDNPDIVERVVVNPVLYMPVSSSIVAVSSVWSGNKKDLSVKVTSGDDSRYGDGTATHVAIVDINGIPVLGLRVLCNGTGEPMLIAGVWTP